MRFDRSLPLALLCAVAPAACNPRPICGPPRPVDVSVIPPELVEAIQTRAALLQSGQSVQGTRFSGGEFEASIYAGDLSSVGGGRGGAAFPGWRGNKPLDPITAVVKRVVDDPCRPGLRLYEVTINDINPCGTDSFPAAPADACETQNADAYQGLAVAVPGGWGVRGQFVRSNRVFTLSCIARGAVAKCAHWGFLPGNEAEARAHRACVRAARADYCGSGESVTLDGTLIDLADTRGIRPPAEGGPPWQLEADWTEDGANCLASPRLTCCPDKPRLAAAIRARCGHALPACEESATRLVRTRMTVDQPASSAVSECVQLREWFCPVDR